MPSDTIYSKAQKSVNWLQNVQENKLKVIFTKIELNQIIHVQPYLMHSIGSYQRQQV